MMGSLVSEEIEDVLQHEVLGRIGCIVDGRPYIVPVTYVYDGECADVYVHSADGAKLQAMRDNPEVCFEVEQVRDMANWRTVIARARFEELWKDHGEWAMALFASRLAPPRIDEASAASRREAAHRLHGASRPILFRLRLTEKTGRYERT